MLTAGVRVCGFSFSPRRVVLRAMQIGITEVTLVIGLPNSSKTTIFNALTRGQIETAVCSPENLPRHGLQSEACALGTRNVIALPA